jgi:hypothetical protein
MKLSGSKAQMSLNMSIDTDPNLQKSVSPQTVVVRSSSRCASLLV